jgi:hypothetical protein
MAKITRRGDGGFDLRLDKSEMDATRDALIAQTMVFAAWTLEDLPTETQHAVAEALDARNTVIQQLVNDITEADGFPSGTGPRSKPMAGSSYAGYDKPG